MLNGEKLLNMYEIYCIKIDPIGSRHDIPELQKTNFASGRVDNRHHAILRTDYHEN